MHELMHLLVDLFFWAAPLGTLMFVTSSAILGFSFAKKKRVWALSALVTILMVLLIPWSFLVERGDALAPVAYLAIVPVMLTSYWLTLSFTRLLSDRA